MKITIVVASKRGRTRFKARIHTASSPEKFHLDPIGFYQKHGKSVPEGTHHEVIILNRSLANLKSRGIHIEESQKNGRPVMCYPKHIPTPERARELFRIWCLGTVLKMVEGVDLNTIYDKECQCDEGKFVAVMRDRFNIAIVEEKTT